MIRNLLLATAASAAFASTASAEIVISEFMYNADVSVGEFVELTNVGSTAIDMTGWSFDDSSQTPGVFDLSGFGIVAPGESVLFTEATAEDFRSEWGLDTSVKVLGGVANNLGRSDEINIYNGSSALVDQLTYGDQDFADTIRTAGISGNTDPSNYGANNIFSWFLSEEGDTLGSYYSTNGDLGNPGTAVIPEPASLGLLPLVGIAGLRRRR